MILYNKNNISIWQFIALMYAATWLVSPFLITGTIWRFLMLILTGYFAVSCCLENKNGSNRHFYFVVMLSVYIVIVSFIVNDIYQVRIGTIIFLAISFYGFFIKNHDIKIIFVKISIEYIMSICILSNVITLRQLARTPQICRLFAKNVDVIALGIRVMRGTGGYGFIYTVLLLLPFALELMLFEHQDKILRVISSIFLLTSYMLIFKAGYFLALLLAVATIFLYFIFKFPDKLNKDRFLIFVLFLILSFVFFDYIVDLVIQFIPIRSIQEKMLSLQSLLNGTEDLQDSEFTTRSERYVRALVNTMISPIFGWFTYRKTGNHSHFIDFSAQYGIPLLYAYIKMLSRPFNKRNILRSPSCMTFITVMGILLLFNSLAFAWGAVLFIFLPLYSAMQDKKNEEIMTR